MKINLMSNPIVPGKKIATHFWIEIKDPSNDKFFEALDKRETEQGHDTGRWLKCSNCQEKQTARVFIDEKGKFYCEACYRDGLDSGTIKPALPKIG